MTLKGPCDFKLEDFYAAPSELFEPYYGMYGLHHSHSRNRNCLKHCLIQGAFDLCCSQVREGWMETATSLGPKT